MKNKFTLGWVLSGIAALVLMLLITFSFYFRTLGNWGVGIIIGALISILMLVLVFLLCGCKTVSIPLNFKKASLYELLLLVLFVFMVAVSSILMSHFFSVLGRQSLIKKDVERQINQIDDMFMSYNDHVEARVAAYNLYLGEVERQKNSNRRRYNEEGLNDYSREDLCIKLEDELSCGDMEANISEWKKTMNMKTSSLGLLFLLPGIDEIATTLQQTRDRLCEKDSLSEKGLNGNHWSYGLDVNTQIKKHFEYSESESFSIWSLIVSLLLSFIMLLTYIAADRDGRHKGMIWELTNSRETSSNSNDGFIGGI